MIPMAKSSFIGKQAWQEAIKVGKEVTESFNDKILTDLFVVVEVYSDMFSGDQHVFNAFVDLLASLFKAVEGAIGFYISWQGMAEIRTLLNYTSTTRA